MIFFGRSVLFKRRQKEYYSEVNLKANEIATTKNYFQKTFKNIWKDKNKGVIFATPNGTKGTAETDYSNKDYEKSQSRND